MQCNAQGLQEKFYKAEQDCFGALEQADTNHKIEDLGPINPLVIFHKCFIFCAAKCPDNIYFILESVENKKEQIFKKKSK
jgi:hypothetical protein